MVRIRAMRPDEALDEPHEKPLGQVARRRLDGASGAHAPPPLEPERTPTPPKIIT